MSLSPRQMFLLDEACKPIRKLFREMIVAAANVEPPTTAGDVMTRYSVMLGACRTPTDRRTDKCGR